MLLRHVILWQVSGGSTIIYDIFGSKSSKHVHGTTKYSCFVHIYRYTNIHLAWSLLESKNVRT